MANKPGAVGRDAENKVKEYLHERGYVYARRLRLRGAKDEGDIYPGDGIPVCIEVKGGQGAISRLPQAIREQVVETVNAGADVGVVVSKIARNGKPAEWIASMTLEQFVDLMARLWPPPDKV
jgi:HJR/Mrr/RecB family endonuclease